MSISEQDVSTLLVYWFVNVQTYLKVFHWQANQYHQHVESGNLYTKLDTLIDRFIETYSATLSSNSKRIYINSQQTGHSSNNTSNPVIKLGNVNNNGLDQLLIGFKNFLLQEVPQKYNLGKHVDLMNIRDEMLQAVNQFMYLYSMT